MKEALLYWESLLSVARHSSHYMELFQALGATLLVAALQNITGPEKGPHSMSWRNDIL